MVPLPDNLLILPARPRANASPLGLTLDDLQEQRTALLSRLSEEIGRLESELNAILTLPEVVASTHVETVAKVRSDLDMLTKALATALDR